MEDKYLKKLERALVEAQAKFEIIFLVPDYLQCHVLLLLVVERLHCLSKTALA